MKGVKDDRWGETVEKNLHLLYLMFGVKAFQLPNNCGS